MRFRLLPLVLVSAVALGRALLTPATAQSPVADESLRRKAYANFAAREPGLRKNAAKDFPTDPWSQSDAFHNYEADEARGFANDHHVALTSVLSALDDGMRSARARGEKTMIATVPPCHPRVSY